MPLLNEGLSCSNCAKDMGGIFGFRNVYVGYRVVPAIYTILCNECLSEIIDITGEQGIEMPEIDAVAPPGTRRIETMVFHEEVKKEEIKEGDMIKSKRKFGVEFEVCLPEEKNGELHEMIGFEHRLEYDGSINAGIEVVTPVLAGAKGEKTIKKVCDSLAKVGAEIDESCSLHLHLDAPDMFAKHGFMVSSLRAALQHKAKDKMTMYVLSRTFLKKLDKEVYGSLSQYIIPNRVLTWAQSEAILSAIEEGLCLHGWFTNKKELPANVNLWFVTERNYNPKETPVIAYQEIEKFLGDFALVSGNGAYSFGLEGALLNPETLGQMPVLMVPKDTREELGGLFAALRSTLSLYAAFDDSLAAMLPIDRRDNDYTERFAVRMSTRELIRTKSIAEIANLWEYGDRRAGSMDFNGEAFRNRERRYCGINLCALSEHGTLEVRYHEGCFDQVGVLHWIKLHQAMIDTAAKMIGERSHEWLEQMLKASLLVNQEQKASLLFRKVGLGGSATEKHFLDRVRKFDGEEAKMVKSLEGAKKL